MLEIYNNSFSRSDTVLNRGFLTGTGLLFLFYLAVPVLLSSSPEIIAGLQRMPKAQMILLLCFPPPLLSLAAMLAVCRYADRQRSLREKLGFNRWPARKFGICVALCALLLLASALTTILFSQLLHALNIHYRPPAFLMLALSCDTPGFILLAAAATLAAPVAEEILFRRVIYGFIAARLGIAASVVLTSLLFALVHDSFVQLPALFLLGVAFQLTYLHFHSLFPAVALHALNNAAAIGAILLVRTLHLPVLQ